MNFFFERGQTSKKTLNVGGYSLPTLKKYTIIRALKNLVAHYDDAFYQYHGKLGTEIKKDDTLFIANSKRRVGKYRIEMIHLAGQNIHYPIPERVEEFENLAVYTGHCYYMELTEEDFDKGFKILKVFH